MSDPLRRRTLKSFVVLLVLLVASFIVFSRIKHSPFEEDISPALRAVLEWNGRIWNPPSSRSVGKFTPPSKGKSIRANGDIGIDSPIDIATWNLRVDDGERHMNLQMAHIKSMPRTESIAEFRCIEGWSQVISYAGVRFSDFIKQISLPGNFKYVGFETPDGNYYVSIDMESLMHDQTILAYEMNGEALQPENGAPLRLVIPIKYGIKNIKRIGKIFFSNERPADYWAERGYDWFSGL